MVLLLRRRSAKRLEQFRRRWESKVTTLKADSMKFIRKLLEKNVYSGVRRIYKQKVKSIPSLKTTLDDGTEIWVKDDVTKAELFLENFLANSRVIEEVDEDRQYDIVERIAWECSSHL